MSGYHLAQMNVGVLNAPLDTPRMSDFVAMLDPINSLADASPGFVWRFRSEGANDATEERPFGDDLLINFSVWESSESLWDFTYRTDHLELLRRRREWFTRLDGVFLVLWWIPAGHVPTLAEAGERLDLIREKGPTPEAFDFRTPFPAPVPA
ncbi:DUF3291 domain-containing protein [Actinorugispora endophytica]|uniref:Uncharacterized protein DUF3291 n=1 Tax=Actinorugispora endophytica TaxID=1605990 RepID=A0A4R6V404_9ACTN|nr:DUF3291 domain-containing protein [Actinorugispora endophytica]TDQ54964.1 uncharacterized protein DUF3291 [Actinorugispora endophytica]